MCRACGSIHSGLETAATPSNQSFFLEWGQRHRGATLVADQVWMSIRNREHYGQSQGPGGCGRRLKKGKSGVHPVNGEVPPVKGRPWKLPHYANRGKTSSSGGELASARSCFSTVRTALGKLRITGLLARFDVARSFPQFPRPLLLQPTIWTSERGADLGSGRCQPRPHLPIYRMTQIGRPNGEFAVVGPDDRPHGDGRFRRYRPPPQ